MDPQAKGKPLVAVINSLLFPLVLYFLILDQEKVNIIHHDSPSTLKFPLELIYSLRSIVSP